MIDYRISVEEFENQAEIMEMARNIVREAFEENEKEIEPKCKISNEIVYITS